MYLLLKRDVAIFHVAKTKILHKEELLDAADSLLWVLKAVNYRYLDLSGTTQTVSVSRIAHLS